jgi:hypothetical protein
MTKRMVIMASAPTSSAARSQAWISSVRFTTESQHIGPGARPLGRSAPRPQQRQTPGEVGALVVVAPGFVWRSRCCRTRAGRQTAPGRREVWIGHVNPSMSLRTVCQLRDVEAGVGAQAVSELSLAIVIATLSS